MTTKEPPPSINDVARLVADLDEELKGIVSDMTEVLDRTVALPEPAPGLDDDPDEVTLPDEFELPEPDEPLPEAETDPVVLPDDFEIAAADISPAADHDHFFELDFEFKGDIEIVADEPDETKADETKADDFDSPLPDFTSGDWDDGPEISIPPAGASEDQPTARIADLTVREFSLLVERAVARGVRRALRKQGRDDE